MTRPFFSLTTAQVVERAEQAMEKRERAAFDAACDELMQRPRSRGSERVADLKRQWNEHAGERRPPGFTTSVDLGSARVELVADARIVERRGELVAAARRTILLSSYVLQPTARTDDPFEDLCGAAARGVHVDVVVSRGRKSQRPRLERMIERLSTRGIHVHAQESQHSKCVVVDDEWVMFGSANHETVFRDLMLVVRSPTLAEKLREYLAPLLTGAPA